MNKRQQRNGMNEANRERLQEVGRRLHDLRTEQQRSVAEVARAMKVPEEIILLLEKGEYPQCELSFLFDLCAFYHTQLEEVLRGLKR
ncbi:MAG: hypothetical protein QM731_02240 [Chitinophagaceae bacterium]